MSWFELCVALGVFFAAYGFALALCRAAADGDRQNDKIAERLAMQNEAFRWPSRDGEGR